MVFVSPMVIYRGGPRWRRFYVNSGGVNDSKIMPFRDIFDNTCALQRKIKGPLPLKSILFPSPGSEPIVICFWLCLLSLTIERTIG